MNTAETTNRPFHAINRIAVALVAVAALAIFAPFAAGIGRADAAVPSVTVSGDVQITGTCDRSVQTVINLNPGDSIDGFIEMVLNPTNQSALVLVLPKLGATSTNGPRTQFHYTVSPSFDISFGVFGCVSTQGMVAHIVYTVHRAPFADAYRADPATLAVAN